MPKVGYKLKELRTRRELGLRELAIRAGVSHSTVSLIERNKMSPSVDTLAALLSALGTTVVAFFSDLENDIPFSAFYGEDDLVEIGNPCRVSHRLVGMNYPNRSMMMLRERYKPNAQTECEIRHAGEEAGIVISGAVQVTVGNESRVLTQGEAYYFDSRKPHHFRNVSDSTSEIISAITPPFY